jgi:hypothetical protein
VKSVVSKLQCRVVSRKTDVSEEHNYSGSSNKPSGLLPTSVVFFLGLP